MPFKEILEELALKTRAHGAIMLDWEGETVDSFSSEHGPDIKLVGAHKGIILNLLKEISSRDLSLGPLKNVTISTGSSRIALFPLKDGYYLLLTLDKKSPFGKAVRESKKAMAEIEKEMS